MKARLFLIIAATTTVVITISAISILSSPQRIMDVFGEWGWMHLVSDERKAQFIGNYFSPIPSGNRMAEYTGWIAGFPYAKRMISVGTLEPLRVLIVDTGTPPGDKYSVSPEWLDDTTFAFQPGDYRVRLVVHILSVASDGVEFAYHAELSPK